jgi:phosphoserine / homoserine phosphotransferase
VNAPVPPPASSKQTIVTLDLEGVLIPEIWIAVAERTGIAELRRTTRDEPNYDVLMKERLAILDERGLTMSLIGEVIAGLAPLDGAREFLDALRARTQVIVLSDTFEQFAAVLSRQLTLPTVLCHRLVIVEDRIVDYTSRMPDAKRGAVDAFHQLNYRVVAAGDSYNDSTMLAAADVGFWFNAPAAITAEFPQFPVTGSYDALLTAIAASL